jgi:hypothetical protein
MIPKVYVNEMSLPVINKEGENKYQRVNGEGQPSLKYDPSSFKIKVSAGPGFAAQQSQAMMQLIQLSQAMPIFAQFMNTKGLRILVDNLNIKGADLLKLMAEEFMQELEQQKQMAMKAQQEQQGQPNPMMLREQNKQAEIQMNAHKNEIQAQIDASKLALEQENLQLKRAELAGKVETEQGYIALEQEKLDAERASKIISHTVAEIEREHKRDMDHIDRHHAAIGLRHKITGKPHFSNK